MAETKKAGARTGSKSVKSVPKEAPIEAAVVTAPAAEAVVEAAPVPKKAPAAKPLAAKPLPVTKPLPIAKTLPTAKPLDAGALLSSVQERGEALRKAVGEAVAVSAKGALEVNDKIIEAINAQHQVTLDLWRAAMTSPDLPQALRSHASATRQAYETASAQWKDVAEATARWMSRSFEPIQSALYRQGR